MKIRGEVDYGQMVDFSIRRDGVLIFGTRLCVPANEVLKREILDEVHNSIFAMHPCSTKMYHSLRGHYWWPGMKRDVAEFLSKCMVCQQVKAKRQKSYGLLQPLPIPE